MITTKAVLAMLLMSAGGATGATVAYMEMNPLAFTGNRSLVVAPAPRMAARPLAPTTAPPEEDRVMVMDAVLVTAGPPRRAAPRAVAVPAEPAPCSGWADLSSGPAGRQVRMLCSQGARRVE